MAPVQREDSLSLAHRRMSARGSPRSRHSTGEVCKGEQRRSRYHFVPSDLLPTEAFHQVTGALQPLHLPSHTHPAWKQAHNRQAIMHYVSMMCQESGYSVAVKRLL